MDHDLVPGKEIKVRNIDNTVHSKNYKKEAGQKRFRWSSFERSDLLEYNQFLVTQPETLFLSVWFFLSKSFFFLPKVTWYKSSVCFSRAGAVKQKTRS